VRPTRIEKTPAQLPDGVIRVDIDGWVFPRSGVAFVWTSGSETTLVPVSTANHEQRARLRSGGATSRSGRWADGTQ
jgi:hypothetical protein